jgi:hypothetical protein
LFETNGQHELFHATISTKFFLIGGHGQDFAILLDGLLGTFAPSPTFNNSIATVQTNAGAKFWIVETTANRGSKTFGVAGFATKHGVAIDASDFG